MLIPKFRGLFNLAEETEKRFAEAYLKELVKKISEGFHQAQTQVKCVSIFEKFSDRRDDDFFEDEAFKTVEEEVNEYLQTKFSNTDYALEALEFWNCKKYMFPRLHLLACWLFRVPATCGSSGKYYIYDGKLDSRRDILCSGDTNLLNELLFIRSNNDII